MTKAELAEINAQLTLPIMEGEQPFALSDQENKFGPDDWAWIFLRRNREYQTAWAKYKGGHKNIEHFLADPNNKNVKTDAKGTCAARFGLATWLNPREKLLPDLKYNGSWFFPLKRPIYPDGRRAVVNDAPYLRNGKLAEPNLPVIETPFGYSARKDYRTFNIDKVKEEANNKTFDDSAIDDDDDQDEYYEDEEENSYCIQVAIDCSVPPAGQISALKALTSVWRRTLIEIHGVKTSDKVAPRQLCPAYTDRWDMQWRMEFKRAGGATPRAKEMQELTALWRLVAFDAIGPLARQAEENLQLLKNEHKSLIAEGLAESPLNARFDASLPAAEDGDKVFRDGGSYLKALLIIAELTEHGFSPNEIAKITGTAPSGTRYANVWRERFHDNIEEVYADQAGTMISQGYKWLIHAQKPEVKTPSMAYPGFITKQSGPIDDGW